MSFCRLSAIKEQILMEAHLRIALAYCARPLSPFEDPGQREHRFLFAFRRPIGSMAVGILSSRLNSPAN